MALLISIARAALNPSRVVSAGHTPAETLFSTCRSDSASGQSSKGSSNWIGSRTARSLLKRRIARLALKVKSGLIRLPVHQALAFHAFDCGKGAVDVAVAERHAVIVAEIELGQIPMKCFSLQC